jgi:hypothetical protein
VGVGVDQHRFKLLGSRLKAPADDRVVEVG